MSGIIRVPTKLFHIPGHVSNLMAPKLAKEQGISLPQATFRIWEHQALSKRELARRDNAVVNSTAEVVRSKPQLAFPKKKGILR